MLLPVRVATGVSSSLPISSINTDKSRDYTSSSCALLLCSASRINLGLSSLTSLFNSVKSSTRGLYVEGKTRMKNRQGCHCANSRGLKMSEGMFIGSSRNVVFLIIGVLLLNLNRASSAAPDKIWIGAIFEQGTDEVQSAFKFALANHNQNDTTRRFDLLAYADVINTADAFKLSRLICAQFSRGVFSMLGAVSPDSFDTLHSYSNTFQMPFVTPWFPEKVLTPSSGLLDFAISMRPDYHRAIIDTVRHYGWKKIIYLYDSHDGNLLIIDCGLHEGWSTTTLPKFEGDDPTIKLTPDQGVLVINFMYLGVGIGSLAPIILMDRIGRKWTLLVASVPKLFSWFALGFAADYETLYLARLLAGIGCGITYSVMPMYLGEISSKRTRGPLGTLMAVLINIGILLIYAIGLYTSRRTMAMISLAVPVMFILTFVWLPETSIFLTRKNRLNHAERTLKWSLGKDNVEAELEEIKRIVQTEDDDVGERGFFRSLREAYRTKANRRAFGIAMILLSSLTLTGAAPVLAYQAFIFEEAGFKIGTNISILMTGCAIVLAGVTCVSLVRSVGKRMLLLFSAPLCVLSLATLATYFTLSSNGIDVSSVNWIPTVFVVIYVVGYGVALNPVPLAYVGEIFAFEVKVPAAICCSLYYAISTTATVKFYQILADTWGTHAPLWAFTLITLILWILIYLYVPETEGKSLEEIQNALQGRNDSGSDKEKANDQ